MAESKSKKAEGLTYKGHPLRRVDNLIYYGTMAEKYIIMMQILNTKKEQDMEVATKVSIQLQLTDPELKSRDRVVKKSEKDSLYAAVKKTAAKTMAPADTVETTQPVQPKKKGAAKKAAK